MLLDKRLNSKDNSFLELYHDIEEFTVKSTDVSRKKVVKININKIICFVYTNITKLQKNGLINDRIFSNMFLENVCNIIYN